MCSCCQYVTPWGCISANRCSPFKPRIDVSFDGRCGLSIADQCPSRARKPNGFGLAVGRNDKSINNGLSGPILAIYADMLEPIRAPRGVADLSEFLGCGGPEMVGGGKGKCCRHATKSTWSIFCAEMQCVFLCRKSLQIVANPDWLAAQLFDRKKKIYEA